MNILNKFRKSIMLCFKLVLVLSMTFVFIGCWQGYYVEALFSNKGNYVVVFSYLVILLAFSNLYGGLKIGTLRLHDKNQVFFLNI